MNPIPNRPNLPKAQRFVQRMVDQFNHDEAAWRKEQDILLALLRLLARRHAPRDNQPDPENP